ncbi:outer membrane porin, OprD family [Pseudomonas sp. PA-6-3C]|uniref:OprD family porin n=3 Tax=Pseudomonas TaxID=286 RepID=UPI001EF00FE2|nr:MULTISPECIES: OprD family porin [Pseudomonas]MCF5144293.1 outer membrane porin, OprD family [Pseudomonas sp. PA-6-3C]MCF5161445.1 outer membrane porin, OprD family [Pseudomonas sp. PA-6-2E]MCF5194090.1 outer membrane porin, OprD family [Pseudomonas sp. PA-6-1H]MCF8972383.1 outer membrane porin, OprD family [Pseudomonas edaphica]
MPNNTLNLILKGAGLMSGGLLCAPVQADFIKDSNADLDLKNYYFNRDYREDAGQSKREEWAQGFILNLKSGFTEGTVGLGVDVVGMLGLKLDSSPDRSGSGLLSRDNDAAPGKPSYSRRAHDEYSKYGVTGKVRVAQSELRSGYLLPDLPTLQPNTSRLFPQTFRGTQVTSTDIAGLALIGGQIDQTKQRESTEYEDMGLTSQSGAYKSTARSDRFRFAGGDYRLTPGMTLSYHFAQLEDIYQQHFIGLKNSVALGGGLLKMDIRYFDADTSGAGSAGNVDNRALSTRAMFSYKGHSVGGGYQEQYGTTPFTYVDGTNTYLFSEYQLSNFSQTNERVWHARYDFDFAVLGVAGLTFSTRWAKGDRAQVKGFAGEGREWERDIDVGYVFQSGALKGVSLRWRNGLSKANYLRDMNENRVIVGYTVALW